MSVFTSCLCLSDKLIKKHNKIFHYEKIYAILDPGY